MQYELIICLWVTIVFSSVVIELNMGIDHAFVFKPYKEWIAPLTRWIRNDYLY